MAFISGIPAKTRVYTETVAMAEINFLCVHKRLRAKSLYGGGGAAHASGPVSTTKTLKVPSQTATPGFRSMERTDVPQVARLLKENLWKFHLAVEYDEKEIAHWMVPRLGVVSAYVVENVESHEITDVCSYYHLPSTIIGDDKHKKIYAAYSFYNVATSVSLTQLMQDALVMAKKEQLDVFNALDVMENAEMLQPLKFGPGSGKLQYYLYNWRCPRMASDRVGLVLC
ncbi:hypothetical protein BBJ29_000453 [Phytophthora kernoviae]|uniref:Glycylpeptide N-tetradecanoyltransferase n=1 Tax=Phytophthora kernoviae TaxID=325452 RepID=A0A3R7JMG5_9STRA|nr:hypothetical protein BBJ29_000453 [Phytophthora kernoviae]